MWVDIQVEMKLTRDKRARTLCLTAFRARSWPAFFNKLKNLFGLSSLFGREPLERDCFASPKSFASSSLVGCAATLGSGVAHEGNLGVLAAFNPVHSV